MYAMYVRHVTCYVCSISLGDMVLFQRGEDVTGFILVKMRSISNKNVHVVLYFRFKINVMKRLYVS